MNAPPVCWCARCQAEFVDAYLGRQERAAELVEPWVQLVGSILGDPLIGALRQ